MDLLDLDPLNAQHSWAAAGTQWEAESIAPHRVYVNLAISSYHQWPVTIPELAPMMKTSVLIPAEAQHSSQVQATRAL